MCSRRARSRDRGAFRWLVRCSVLLVSCGDATAPRTTGLSKYEPVAPAWCGLLGRERRAGLEATCLQHGDGAREERDDCCERDRLQTQLPRWRVEHRCARGLV